jgi:hypothetical protein
MINYAGPGTGLAPQRLLNRIGIDQFCANWVGARGGSADFVNPNCNVALHRIIFNMNEWGICRSSGGRP